MKEFEEVKSEGDGPIFYSCHSVKGIPESEFASKRVILYGYSEETIEKIFKESHGERKPDFSAFEDMKEDDIY